MVMVIINNNNVDARVKENKGGPMTCDGYQSGLKYYDVPDYYVVILVLALTAAS